jgi:hypothetical protein
MYTMGFYSAIRKDKTMWFEGKRMELGGIMLSEISQLQKDKGSMFSSHMWKINPKDNIYTKPSFFIHKLICRT